MNKIENHKVLSNGEAICGVLINEKRQILLAKRTALRTYSKNLYDLMGGDIISGETPIETLFRDAQKKFGIQLNKDFIEQKGIKDMDYPNRTIKTHIFTCQIDSSMSIQLDTKKYDTYDWYYPMQIERLDLAPKVKEVLLAVGLLR